MRTSTQIEALAYNAIENVLNGRHVEDSTWELKSQLLESTSAYRQLAGHANAAHGEPIYWLIGIDEKQRVVNGADQTELANWYPQVQKCFEDGLAPELALCRALPYDGRNLLLLQFLTDRAPYVTKVAGAPDQLEVLWREGTRTRSARRRDLLKVLLPIPVIPECEVVFAEAQQVDDGTQRKLTINGHAYLFPKSHERLTIPRHKLETYLRVGSSAVKISSLDITRQDRSTSKIFNDQEQIILIGPGLLKVQAIAKLEWTSETPSELQFILRLPVMEADGAPIIIDLQLAKPILLPPHSTIWSRKNAT